MPKLLLIDDDAEVLSINAKYFALHEYEVKTATTATKGMQLLPSFLPDCIVLDVMMPGMDGYKACSQIKKICDVPIIFLTGKASEDDKIKGLLIGGDDYMIKPYSLRELEARIKVLIRRYQKTNTVNASSLSYPPLSLNLTLHKAYVNDEEILLSNKEYELLYLLAASPNQTFSFEEIGKQIWNSYMESDRRTIMVTASRLRKKLDSYPDLPKFIETVWSKGYQFVIK